MRWLYDWADGHVRSVDTVQVEMADSPKAWPTSKAGATPAQARPPGSRQSTPCRRGSDVHATPAEGATEQLFGAVLTTARQTWN